jgi:hypothetical protein
MTVIVQLVLDVNEDQNCRGNADSQSQHVQQCKVFIPDRIADQGAEIVLE